MVHSPRALRRLHFSGLCMAKKFEAQGNAGKLSFPASESTPSLYSIQNLDCGQSPLAHPLTSEAFIVRPHYYDSFKAIMPIRDSRSPSSSHGALLEAYNKRPLSRQHGLATAPRRPEYKTRRLLLQHVLGQHLRTKVTIPALSTITKASSLHLTPRISSVLNEHEFAEIWRERQLELPTHSKAAPAELQGDSCGGWHETSGGWIFGFGPASVGACSTYPPHLAVLASRTNPGIIKGLLECTYKRHHRSAIPPLPPF